MSSRRRHAPTALRHVIAAAVVSVAAAGTLAAQAQPARPAAAHGEKHGEKHEEGEAHHAIPWKKLDAFHTVMAASWHPAKDRNDLAPFRARASELVAAAKALTSEPIPASCGGAARTASSPRRRASPTIA
ncbi:MAG: hypothetical protein MUF40_07840 [Gemmatimonadaceae bacterium]|nr:hypothetical protein [Gemmatimonadaceae bacterium]